ncbi:excinuclease ABC subunit UvrB [Aminiphilus circumscriptus]|jgi:excinuclease ABC subunit B|uniref:excinuclease ABC subunit UvrB n=1 Tax=Aminiphilus circumscriptus TaxID=290732 RepID=UPI0004926F01|nr:excinuclease ABC subunit UvrB [Aminiphilus circumscriptus]
MQDTFSLRAPWPPSGDQPKAIGELLDGLEGGARFQTLLGVTGSGKTFTIANVAAQLNRPVLVLAHNKTLAAQLYSEFKLFFPDNAVHYFVSYYDYYQPEAYVPAQDLYIEKDASINERIEKLRLATTKALLERRDVIVVASVSCIYGLGQRKNYEDAVFSFAVGDHMDRRHFLERLLENYYERNDFTLERGNFRVRGDVVELYPAYSDTALRICFFDEEIERIDEIDPVSGGQVVSKLRASIFPAQHYVTSREAIEGALGAIRADLDRRVAELNGAGRIVEAHRLAQRTRYDLEMLSEVGYCSGIENYSVYLDGRRTGEQPGTLLDFFPRDFIMVIDESHMTIPQIRGMYNGDRARKETLVEHGFRLPTALDNRPLTWEEFSGFMHQVIFVSATPGDWELEHSDRVVEQIVRPTGVVDPKVLVLPAKTQVDDLLDRLRDVVARGERALVTTLTKRSAEDFAEYLVELGIKGKYIHSELDAFERADLLREIREGTIDVLVGINLLREGIDLPEVSLVAILDADREGFLRSTRSLVQIIGRAARNIGGTVILYADEITESIRRAVEETDRRRAIQEAYNQEHGITPRSIRKDVASLLPPGLTEEAVLDGSADAAGAASPEATEAMLEKLMWEAVEKLDFEKAAKLRDRLLDLRGGVTTRVANPHRRKGRKRT